HAKGGEAKADVEDARTVPGKSIADAAAGGGVVGATVTQATDALTPASGIPAIQKILTIVTVVGAVIAVAAITYRLWARGKQREIDDALDRRTVKTDPANDNERAFQAEAA
ncbi:MAG TPA: hypothetical protein VL017_08840, partial [Devosia sp.]|nr:hypothetical protein [Devosia sp.]